jgi:hypothetical protein
MDQPQKDNLNWAVLGGVIGFALVGLWAGPRILVLVPGALYEVIRVYRERRRAGR